jgi:hypothetical protein
VWAAGVSLYVLLQGGFPFTRPGDDGQPPQRALQSMFLRIVAGRYAPLPQVSRPKLARPPRSRAAVHTPSAADISCYCETRLTSN